jgi:cytosine permease
MSQSPITGNRSLADVVEDHALNRVPQDQRKGGWTLSWMTMGIVTTLVQLTIGSYASAVDGVGLAVLAGVLVALFGGGLGWLVGNISRHEGISSTVTSRFYGFGYRGSIIASAIFSFMILGFLALENALLYYGTLFALGWNDTTGHRVLIYGVLTVLWIVLTTFGVNQVIRVSSILVVAFLILLLFMVDRAGFQSGTTFAQIFGHPALIPGLGGGWSRFATVLVALAGSQGALALVDADYARYARKPRDVVTMAFSGSFMMGVIILLAGSIIVYGGMGPVIHYLLAHHAATPATAVSAANSMAANDTGAYFVVLSAVAGFILMYAAQAKAQVLNTYSGSLALTNFFDAVANWRPGRFFMVVLGNLIAMAMVAAGILSTLEAWLNILGIATTAFCAVMIADYYLVRRQTPADRDKVEAVNVAGVVSVVVGSLVAIILENSGVFPLGFLTALVVVGLLYVVLRQYVLRPGAGTPIVSAGMAMREFE